MKLMNLLKTLDRLRPEGMSRAKWLRAAGVAESTWYRWIADENSPTLGVLNRLTNELGCELKPVKQGVCGRCKKK